jgi:DNA-binding FrmR family transcriptional regulator
MMHRNDTHESHSQNGTDRSREHEHPHDHSHQHEHSPDHNGEHEHPHDRMRKHDHSCEHPHDHDGEHGHSPDHNGEHEHSHGHSREHEHSHAHTHTHNHTKQVLDRLARAIGHLTSVRRMVEEGRDCSEVLIQLAAVRSAINGTCKVILKDHLDHCIVDAVNTGDMDTIDDLNHAIEMLMK